MKKLLMLLLLTSCGQVLQEQQQEHEQVEQVTKLEKLERLSPDCRKRAALLLEIAENQGTANSNFEREEELYLHYCGR